MMYDVLEYNEADWTCKGVLLRQVSLFRQPCLLLHP